MFQSQRNPWTAKAKVGFVGWFLLSGLCSIPFHWLGLSDQTAGGIGMVIGTIATFVIVERMATVQSRARVREMTDATNRGIR
jgi:hypothetical protein